MGPPLPLSGMDCIKGGDLEAREDDVRSRALSQDHKRQNDQFRRLKNVTANQASRGVGKDNGRFIDFATFTNRSIPCAASAASS